METKIYATIDQDNFFPTPENLAEKMLEPVNFKKVQSILEPEAGKGDLVDSIMRKLIKTREWHIDCVEMNYHV